MFCFIFKVVRVPTLRNRLQHSSLFMSCVENVWLQ